MDISDYIATGAAIVSVSACAINIWQASISKKHNQLSVKPMLHFDCILDNDLVLKIKNTGTGPAIINNCSLYFNEVLLGSNSQEIAYNLFEELEVQHLGGRMYIPGIRQAMPAGESYEIMRIDAVISDNQVMERIMNDLTLLTIDLNYESIYGEKFDISGPDFS
ncbi:hypothetical protein [Photobacterium lutimaris]|uniref:Uncharacterized protein n=1 Tax=Photobacterium lutimaris TaxID=388278 RepID=A0A2T3J0P7_9GAMM|nr:hypothetical protein [Photobacterium lutimaris]PSU34617.1 hypothetical protein C9I99_05835 [Photobacterium lutimaris]TDR71539.1 hypothetical protein DFP78_11673 [Photobacterium lutimaris]